MASPPSSTKPSSSLVHHPLNQKHQLERLSKLYRKPNLSHHTCNMQCPSKSNQNWKPSATKQFQKRPKKNACVLSLLYTIYIYIIQYSIVVPSGTLAMYDIVCHSHSLLFLQHQYYNNTTQIQLHQMVKGRRCLWAQQRGYVCCILSLSFRFALQLCTSQN